MNPLMIGYADDQPANPLMAGLTDMGGYTQVQAGTAPQARAYTPTLRERLAQWWMGDNPQPATTYSALGLLGTTGLPGSGSNMGVADAFPVLGQAMQVQDAYRSGDDRNLAMALMPGPKPKGIRAYHGSPHDFDRFDMSKIGTGEGAQAYGHGLYFAEAEDVAKTYKQPITALAKGQQSGAETVARQALTTSGSPQAAEEFINQTIAHLRKRGPEGEKAIREFYEPAIVLVRNGMNPNEGRLYEVRINASPDDFLDWDKPLSAQSEKVRAALNIPQDVIKDVLFQKRIAAGEARPRDQARMPIPEVSIEDVKVGDLINRMGSNFDKRLSDEMRNKGVAGIRYIDQGSRRQLDSGSIAPGTINYVVFDDKIVDIVRKYGIAYATAMFGADAVMQASQGQTDENPLMRGLSQ